MDTNGGQVAMGHDTTEKRTKMVQIAIMFQTDTDADAMAVKTLISEALKDRKGMAIQFNLRES